MDMVESGRLEGGTGGPLNVLLRSPELGEAFLRYGAYERFHTPLSAKLNALAVAMLLNTDRYPLPDGTAPELKPLADPIP
jgi:hypothetical protein